MQGQTGHSTSCGGSLVPQTQRVSSSNISASTAPAYFRTQTEKQLFLEGTCTAFDGGDPGVWHSPLIQNACLVSRGQLHDAAGDTSVSRMSILLLIVEIAVPRALGWVPTAPNPQLSLLSVCESFSSYFSDFLTLLRTGNGVAEMQKTHPKTVLSPSLVPCCHPPWSPLQLSQHEQELSQSDFSPMGAERFRHLLGKASWEVSNFFFFANAKCLAALWESIQVYGCSSWSFFEVGLPPQLSHPLRSCLMLVNLRLIYVPEKQDYHLSQMQKKLPFSIFLIRFLEKFFVCHWEENWKKQSPAVNAWGLAHSRCSPRSIQRLWLLIVTAEAACGADNFFTKKTPSISLSKIWVSIFLWSTIHLNDWKIIWISAPSTIFQLRHLWNLLVRFCTSWWPRSQGRCIWASFAVTGRKTLLKHNFCYLKVGN